MSLVPFRDIVWKSVEIDVDTSPSMLDLAVDVDANHVTMTSTSAVGDLQGINPSVPGRPLWISYTGTQQVAVKNNGGGAPATSRIRTSTGATVTLTNGKAVCLVYNDVDKVWDMIGGVFGGITDLNGLTDATQTLAAVDDTNVTLDITSAAGAHTFELGWTGALSVARGGTGVTSRLMRVLDADATGVNGTSAQPWFPTTGAASIQSGKAYRISGLLMMTHGTTSTSVAIGFAGSATYTMGWSCVSIRRTDGQAGNTAHRAWRSSAVATVISPAATTGGGVYEVSGIVRCTAQGTFIPQFTFSAAPGGTITIKANSFFLMEEIGTNTVTTIGNW